ncbi:MAG: polysaccharide deacetylase family protein [Clostridia bacterium]|nr:polysaccharide deacetylase family protein [Clostridia bacterium]
MKKQIIRALFCNLALVLIAVMIGGVCFFNLETTPVSTEENVYRSGNAEHSVSLMFNVYWGTEEVYEILDLLDKYGAKSTFFIGGSWADDNISCVKEILKRGHEIGSHGYFHKDGDKLSLSENKEEIALCHKLILLATGYEMRLFAPPSGAYGDDTLKAAEELGYKVILWSKDTVDWRDRDASVIYARAKDARGGDFVLMHPTKETVVALEGVLKYYKKEGLSAVTVSENLGYGG